MKKQLAMIALTAILIVVAAGGYMFLKPKPIGPMPGAPMGAPNAAAMEDFQKLHKYSFQLIKLLDNIGRIEKNGKSELTTQQAKSVLAVIDPLRKKKTLDETSAKQAISDLQTILTDNQRSAISALPADNQFKSSATPPGPPPSGAQSGPPPSMGPKPMNEFNPLNPPKGGPSDIHGKYKISELLDNLRRKSAS